jgi:hypothetical protein
VPTADDAVRIEGLREFRANLRQMDRGLARQTRVGLNEAAKIIVRAAKPRVPRGPAAGGHAAASIKASSTATSARVSAGGNRYPYYPWLDYGGNVGPADSVHRTYRREGRYIYPAFVDNRAEVEQELATQIARLAQRAGIGVTRAG